MSQAEHQLDLAKFARIKGRHTIHIYRDGETLCGCDLVDGHPKFRAERWYTYEGREDFPDGSHLCFQCDQAFANGTTLDSTELTEALRDAADLPRQNRGYLTKSKKVEILKVLNG